MEGAHRGTDTTTRVVVRPLTLDLANRFKEVGHKAWQGNRTCSLENMKTSCFAAEECNLNGSCKAPFQLSSLVDKGSPVVAMDETNASFLGCATAERCEESSMFQILYPHVTVEAGAGFVFGLCVDSSCRRSGAAREILRHMNLKYPTIYLTVRLPDRGARPDVRDYMSERSSKLVGIYEHLGFSTVTSSAEFVLMRRHRAGGADGVCG